jgi:hypothetical protein
MKLFSVSVGLLLVALGVFFVPVSFSVDGFGLVVHPGGVRSVRASDPGTVLHFDAKDGRFQPGEIVTAVAYPEALAENSLLAETMRSALAKVEADHIEKVSKARVDLERDAAKLEATRARLAQRDTLRADTAALLEALRAYTVASASDIDALNAERLAQLQRLEDLVQKSGAVSALPAQRLATMLEDIQAERLSVISSKASQFGTERTILDLVKALNTLTYDTSIDRAEVEILSGRIAALEQQIRELETLRDSKRAEAEARFLAKAIVPQLAIADAVSVDMRTLQATRADVEKGDALRLLARRDPEPGLSVVIFGAIETGQVALHLGGQTVPLSLTATDQDLSGGLAQAGLPVKQIVRDAQTVGAMHVQSMFLVFDAAPPPDLVLLSAKARDAGGQPVPVLPTLNRGLSDAAAPETAQNVTKNNEIIGFLENRHAVVLQPGQRVRGSINDTRTGSEIVFDARLKNRDFATVDTKELGIRLGNQSLAGKIIKRGVLSQIVIEVDAEALAKIEHLPGAVVHLSFPLARQSLFSFLLARDASI